MPGAFLDDPLGNLQQDISRQLPNGVLRNAFGNLTTSDIPSTSTRTTFAATIHARVGATSAVIGAVQDFNVTQTRVVEDEYEINSLSLGLPRDLVPQILSGRTLEITRFDLWTKIMESVFFTKDIVMLSDQARGFYVREQWRDPGALFGSVTRLYEYGPCFFTNLGRRMSANGNRIVSVSASMVWLARTQIL